MVRISPTGIDARILIALQGRGPSTATELGRELGLDRMPVSGALNRLQRCGLVRQAGVTQTPRSWGVAAPMPIWETVTGE